MKKNKTIVSSLSPIRHIGHISLISLISLLMLWPVTLSAQIKIGGNVYGGGNHADVKGSTKVTVKSGDIGAILDPDAKRPLDDPHGRVFGGARMADVGGNTFVHIDGQSDLDAGTPNYILINQVYGGNDIAGHIGTAKNVGEGVPAELVAVKSAMPDPLPEGITEEYYNDVNDEFNSYVRVSTKVSGEKYTQADVDLAGEDQDDPAYGKTPDVDLKPAADARKVYIGQLFAGGNGDFDYVQTPGPVAGKVTHNIYNRWDEDHTISLAELVTDEGEVGFQLPEQDSTYLEVMGGSIVYAYGGGNNATVKEKNIIHIDNPSAVVNHIKVDATGKEDENGTDLLDDYRFLDMGINTTFSKPSSGAFQIGRFFGGNNKAEMTIRPTWNLLAGKVRNLYSGGNKGNMTSPEGLLLEIKDYSTLIVDNLYGGCRMADVMPTQNGVYTPCTNLDGYKFPNELAARTLVRGGHVNNVYGGNDVTGIVYGGNAVGIYTTIYGDVYGGGNGDYPYTDASDLVNDKTYGDFNYSDFRTAGGYTSSVDALNAFRPNAEQVSVRLKGTAEKTTVIKGSVFVGGNCASLATKKSEPLVELKMGSHVLVDKVYLGNNGEGMVEESYLERYADDAFSSLQLKTDPSIFASYMDGVAMPLRPNIVFDNTDNGDPETYIDYSSKVGSFYCGGNRGSMTASGKNTLKFNKGLIIFEKLVGGCNNADVAAGTYNAEYKGGILGSSDEQTSYTDGGKIKDRIELDLENVVIEPRRWNDTFDEIGDADIVDGKLKAGQEYYTTNMRSSRFIAKGTEEYTTEATDKYYKLTNKGEELVWNTAIWDLNEDDFKSIGTGGTGAGTDGTGTEYDKDRRLLIGNVYGGCYNSGHVNGNVVINIKQDLIKRDVVFAEADSENPYAISGERRSGVLKEAQGDDVMAVAMTVFGGGCGEETEVWGSATVNLNNGYAFQIFGGGEEGIVGKTDGEGNKAYDAAYSTTVNMQGANAGYSEKESGQQLAETEYIYGGGNEGDVLGDSYVYLGNGRIYDAFGGASNADIYGGTEVYVGYNEGFPWIRDNVYGGNDFGGTIRGSRNHYMTTTRPVFDNTLKESSTYVKYIQGRVDSIFGGCYGNYNYEDRVFKNYTDAAGKPLIEDGEPIFNFPHLNDNSYVQFVPVDNSSNQVGYIFGGSSGYPGNVELNNAMQEKAYVLIDDTNTKDENRFANADIYGGGAFAGVGTSTSFGAGFTAVDLFAGSFHNVYGGCNQEGLVGYTRVNVPSESTVKVNALFGGGKGYDPALFDDEEDPQPGLAERYCDHYVTCIDYKSKDAIVNDAIYGGNQNCRIACDTYINIEAPVMQSSGYQATVYGAGYGKETVSGRTNVFMNNGSNAYKVCGGGRDGNAFNFASLRKWLANQFKISYPKASDEQIEEKVEAYGITLANFGTYLAAHPITLPTSIGTYPDEETKAYNGTYTNDILTGDYHQTNVHIMNGGNVSGYAYGGGYGTDAVVSGRTYIELKGGNVDKDIYGGGQGGPVFDDFGLGTGVFTAKTNVYIEGGMARNVYGGGYLGHVGKHIGEISASNDGDIPAVVNVTIGKTDGTSFYNGVPAILRNVYGGGEGGSVYGTANLTINNGYVGYRYKNTATSGSAVYEYVEELDDQKPNSIEMAGNAFGGGYVVNSYVDNANVEMYGGTLRGSLYGGGEVGPIGRGTMKDGATTANGGIVNGKATIYKAGKTHVKLFDGHVKRNVFGGGRGKDSWGGDGTKYMDEALLPTLDLKCKGYVFGQTEVDVYGGEVGTDEGVAQGYGNVFGGGDIGCVYSAYEQDIYYTQAEIDAAASDPEADAYGKTTSDVKTPGVLCFGKKNGTRYDGLDNNEGYYYKNEGGAFITDNNDEYILTEDCKVVVEPWCKATSAVEINGESYAAGTYVPTSALNYLGNKDADKSIWNALGKDDVNKEGVIVHNAVFAGGNTSPGSTEVYANTTTVFGNATASIHDVYNRDLISIGRGRVGGLYGDGNLTLIDGYRELNITNYGTDYYHIKPEITLTQYNELPYREQAYYEIRYKCQKQCTDNTGKTYAVNSTITADEMVVVFDGVKVGEGESAPYMIQPNGKPLEEYWKENGVCSRYAGRPMNTIQRADFCGVFGSRMVMQGAQDRVPETVDYTNYTINRVREVSLNKKVSVRPGDSGDTKNKEHGNYFGIYSVVNFLGALTSDFDFGDETHRTDKRTTDNSDTDTYQATANGQPYGSASFYDWKKQFHEERKRNNGNSHNKLALASGVYLELTNENGRGTDLYEKEWGLITGVVELDLINVQPGMGGGYVYAKNEHGIRSNTDKDQVILTALNAGAVTNKHFRYDETENTKKEWETSGNFVHSTQTIIDDCYNIGGKYNSGYKKPDGVPAHYWFIRGAVYVYDQYISAYTGSPNAFSETVSIPLTITSASHGKMTLLNVQPNYYAYYSANLGSTPKKLGENSKIELRDKEYGLNDAINYWDYTQLTSTEKSLFVNDTYTVIADCTYGDSETPVTYKAGTVLLASDYASLKASAPKKNLDDDEDTPDVPYVHHVSRNMDVDFDYVFRPSNNVSHTSGYILTYNIDNPNQWNTWYTPKTGSSLTGKMDSEHKPADIENYEDGPTYTPNATGMYGQNDYTVGSIISNEEYTTYGTAYAKLTDGEKAALGTQATFNPAYIVTAELLETTKGSGTAAVAQRLHKGATLAREDYTDANWDAMSGSVAEAYVVTKTIQLSKTEFIYRNTYLTADEISTIKSGVSKAIQDEIDNVVLPAYYCTTAGKYGGNYYEAGHNYRALAAYSAMSESDRTHFTYNYDALDLLIDPTYSRDEAQKYQYDGNYTSAEQVKNSTTGNKATYSLVTPIDYSATYKGDTNLSYKADDGSNTDTDTRSELTRTEFESLPNEQYYWAPITVSSTSDTYYVVTETIILGDTPYAAGQVISSDSYEGLGDSDRAKVAKLKFSSTGTYYYCREDYTIDASVYTDENKGKVTDILNTEDNEYTSSVPAGIVITSSNYGDLVNKQKNFSIHGLAPTETSTLYVTRGSDIFDLSAEKIITVIYQYDYVESDMAGTHITPVSERHVLNIHLNFKSGVPTVEDIQQPDIILPGTMISIPEPYVTPGAYEITGGGWKLFDTASDAESHINGVEYSPTDDPLYLYQHKYYLAYYAKTYLGETFSNHVPVSVANYHDLKKVMGDTDHHYYIDHKDVHERLKVEPKIYINDYSKDAEGSKNGLDLFKNLYDLSLLTTSPAESTDPLYGHNTLNERVKAGKNLEFFLRTDINYPDTPDPDDWTPIASGDDPCFQGTLHGDGHTISGLDHSLFDNLCGDVYNLGVTGSFTSAGVADKGTGYVESAWISTSNTAAKTGKPVFGAPNKDDYVQIVNSYYMEEDDAANKYTNHSGSYGIPTRKTAQAFYNGEVAYDLNNFYLYKRYNDGVNTAAGADYKYWKPGEEEPQTGYYIERQDLCSSGYKYKEESGTKYYIRYVEDRFADGDFRYAGGTIPEEEDERLYVDPEDDSKVSFYPIWPDDYIFFGQKLNYGWAVEPHQNVPTAVVRNNGRLSTGSDANRVYRAPAYYRSKVMGVAHFNPQAYLAQQEKLTEEQVEALVTPRNAYPNMTAIDFNGHNDLSYQLGDVAGKFYTPLLDDGGLTGIVNCDETHNLLVYSPASGDNAKTFNVLKGYFEDPKYDDYYKNTGDYEGYRLVAEAPKGSVYGHLVQSTLKATSDHLLVDKQDFNAPISYTFDDGHLMWYQRTPLDEEYVDTKNGWQGISVPFTAELVTTNDKGEITHFYNGSETSKNGTGGKIGHEYWLREYKDGGNVDEVNHVYNAVFNYPNASSGSKDVTNTFLWDYYYQNERVHNQMDAHSDKYEQDRQYYKKSRPYSGYPLLQAATPYILGLPGSTYYEFDLSGNFEAENTKVSIPKLGKQVITLASEMGATIDVSDDEIKTAATALTFKGYTFKPSYMNESLEAGTGNYVMNAAGNSFDKLPASGDATVVTAFRPYFTTVPLEARGMQRFFAKKIVFGGAEGGFGEGPETVLDGSLEIFTRGYNIVTISHMEEATTIRIVNASGNTITNYVLQPGETIETPVPVTGVYVVNKKKVFVE